MGVTLRGGSRNTDVYGHSTVSCLWTGSRFVPGLARFPSSTFQAALYWTNSCRFQDFSAGWGAVSGRVEPKGINKGIIFLLGALPQWHRSTASTIYVFVLHWPDLAMFLNACLAPDIPSDPIPDSRSQNRQKREKQKLGQPHRADTIPSQSVCMFGCPSVHPFAPVRI